MAQSTFQELFTSKLDVAPLYMGYNSKDEEIIFFVKETGNKEHEKCQRKYAKPLERSRKNKKRNRAIMAKIVAESILDGWQGVLGEDGEPIEPTVENKVDALVQFKKLFYEVLNFAADSTNFAGEEEADDDEIDEDADELTAEEETEKN